MNYRYILALTSLLFSWTVISAQSFTEHRWQDRLILILAKPPRQVDLDQQLALLTAAEAGLRERRLFIYQITPGAWRRAFPEADVWQSAPDDPYAVLKVDSGAFEVLLIGLDGRVKLRRTSLVTVETLFEYIDQMPMRRAEMRKN
jgi:hypothetical protein